MDASRTSAHTFTQHLVLSCGRSPWVKLTEKSKKQTSIGIVLLASFFTVSSFSLVPVPWWNWPDSLPPCTVLSLWLWKRSTKGALVSTQFWCGQIYCSSSSDFFSVLVRISCYLLESRRMALPLKSRGPWTHESSPALIWDWEKDQKEEQQCGEGKQRATAKQLTVADENPWRGERTLGYKRRF